MRRLGAVSLIVVLACGEGSSSPSATPTPTPKETPEPAEAEASSSPSRTGPKVTVDRSKGTPVVTAFGVQLNEAAPPPDSWHWNEGEVMLGGGPRMPMVKVAAGTFTMGSSPYELGRDDDELAHQVTLSAYWVGATEVTRGQWRAVMGSDAPDCYDGCTDAHPVVQVSWIDAVGFANALSRQLGLGECHKDVYGDWSWEPGCDGFRLPSEAEWENAARAGTTTPYSFGTVDDLCANANGGHSWSRSCSDDFSGLAPVKSFPANPWGIYDMHGNAREWIWDWDGDYSAGAVVDPRGPTYGSSRCLRGGSFENDDRFLRSAFRDSISPTVRSGNMGFRVVRSAPTLR